MQPVPPRRAANAQQRLGEVRGDCVLCHVLYVQHRVVSGRLGGGALVRVKVRVRVRVRARARARVRARARARVS